MLNSEVFYRYYDDGMQCISEGMHLTHKYSSADGKYLDTRHQHAWTRDGYGRDKCIQKENLREIVKIWFLKSYGTQSPLLSSEISMVVLFTGPSCGVLVTKLAIRSVMMLGFCILCAGLIATLYVPSYHYLFICFFIMGKESRGANNFPKD